jgi:hypothetical protein
MTGISADSKVFILQIHKYNKQQEMYKAWTLQYLT